MHTLQVAAAIAPLLGLGAASSRYSTPNATRSVNFKPFGNDDTEWTWSVNVTDTRTDPNVHYVRIDYDFSWPGGGSLDSTPGAAKNPNGTFCVAAPISWGTAKNITDKYTDANTHSTDCTPVLGSAYVDAILTASAENDDGTGLGCFHRSWSKYPECANTFGIAEYAPYDKQGLELETNSLMPRYLRSGGVYHSFTESGLLPDTNSPGLYESAVNMLQVILLRPPAAGPGEGFSPALHCMRVNTKEGVNVGSGSEDGNSGASRGVAAGGLWAVMGSLAVALL